MHLTDHLRLGTAATILCVFVVLVWPYTAPNGQRRRGALMAEENAPMPRELLKLSEEIQSAQAERAILAAWESARRGLHDGSLDYFIGFVDGRLRVLSPAWWKQLLRPSGVDRQGNLFVQLDDFWPYIRGANGIQCRQGVRVDSKGNDLVLSLSDKGILLPASLMDQAKSHGPIEVVEAALVDDAVYVGVASLYSCPYRLARLDSATGGVLWSTEVLRGHGLLGKEGPGFHFFSIHNGAGDDVVIFGISDTEIYIESFANEDGTPRLRFSSPLRGRIGKKGGAARLTIESK